MTLPGQITIFAMASASLAEFVPGKPSCDADAARKRLAGGAAGSPGARDGRGKRIDEFFGYFRFIMIHILDYLDSSISYVNISYRT